MFGPRWFGRGWAGWLWLATVLPAFAEVPKNAPPEKDTLQAVLDRIHNHAAGDAWKQPGWKDDAIQAYLDKLVAAISVAGEIKDLKVPVRLADVKPPDPAARIRLFREEGQLIVGKDIKIRSASRSIILADGSVELQSTPEDCIIIARHAVVGSTITRRCLIIAGTYVEASIDGEPGNVASGSIILCPGTARVRSAYGSIIASRDPRVDSCTGALFVNSEVKGRDRGGSRSVMTPSIALEPLAAHPLCNKIEVLGVVSMPPPPPAPGPGGLPPPLRLDRSNLFAMGLVFRLDGRRHFASVNEPIVDDAGNAVPALSGWQLAFVADSLAVFRNGEADAVLRIEAK